MTGSNPRWPGQPVGRRALLLGAGALAVSACSTRQPDPQAAITGSPSPSASTVPKEQPGGRMLLAYFSRPGENYWNGGRRYLQVGNTAVVAGLIAARLPIDTWRIEAAEPYPDAYEPTVERNQREQREDARPALASDPPSMTGYSTLLLGCPVWNVRAPMIMRTFLERVDLAGKTVLPFVTYAVSGMGRVADEVAELAPRATVAEGLAVRGEESQQAGADVERWLRESGLPLRAG